MYILHKRLIVRGYKAVNVDEILKMAVQTLNNKLNLSTLTTSTLKSKPIEKIIFYYKYHPCDVSRKVIRSAYGNIYESKNVQH